MATKKASDQPVAPKQEDTVTTTELARAFREAMEAAKPAVKKTVVTRTKNTPWTPKDGSPKLKLKRKIYQHSHEVDIDKLSNEEIDSLNKLRPGTFCNGLIQVVRRRDKGLDILYRIKTNEQRLRLVHEHHITSFRELAERCIWEAAQPKKDEYADDDE